MSEPLLLAVTATCAIVMAVVAWYVQVQQYPAFLCVPESEFQNYHRIHCARIGAIVVPAMLGELIGAIGLLWVAPSVLSAVGVSLATFAIAWTFLCSARLHGKLSRGYSLAHAERLIRTNWPRTVAWSLHAVVAAAQWMALTRVP